MNNYAQITRAINVPEGGRLCFRYESQLFLIKDYRAFEILQSYYEDYPHITVNYVQQ